MNEFSQLPSQLNEAEEKEFQELKEKLFDGALFVSHDPSPAWDRYDELFVKKYPSFQKIKHEKESHL